MVDFAETHPAESASLVKLQSCGRAFPAGSHGWVIAWPMLKRFAVALYQRPPRSILATVVEAAKGGDISPKADN